MYFNEHLISLIYLKNEIHENEYLENIYLDIALRLIANFRLIALALYACEISLTRCHILNDLKKPCSCIWAEPKNDTL